MDGGRVKANDERQLIDRLADAVGVSEAYCEDNFTHAWDQYANQLHQDREAIEQIGPLLEEDELVDVCPPSARVPQELLHLALHIGASEEGNPC